MTTQPPPGLAFNAAAGQSGSPPPSPPAVFPEQLIAPVWHTVLIVIVILANSYFASARLPESLQSRAKISLYFTTMIWQIVLFGLVWMGMGFRKAKMREIIGGRWNTVEDFLLDVAIAAGFWLVSISILAGVRFALGLASFDAKRSAEQVKQAIGSIAPQTVAELAAFVLLAVFAGVFEEIIFRGYLQRQIGAIARNRYVGVGISAIVFGAGHGYQGTRQMIVIAVYGALFGALVLLRKSLRPGMIAHAWQDAFSGVVVFLLRRAGMM